MNPFEFSIPQNIIVGAGTLAKLPECAKKMGGTHAMILSGPTLKKMGVVDKAADSLKAAGIAADIFTDIEANPSSPASPFTSSCIALLLSSIFFILSSASSTIIEKASNEITLL